jgi:trehalose/maltose transport system substrate-binding protein
VLSGRVLTYVKRLIAAATAVRRSARARRGKHAILLALPLLCSLAGPARTATIAIACGAVGVEFELCRHGAEAWAARTGHTIKMISTPNDANERLALFQQLLAARSPDIDVFQIDVVWPGILAPYLEDLTLHIAREEIATHLPVLVANNRVDGRLVALPWFADVGLLYFRRDLLEKYGTPVPQTWHELAEIARTIQEGERSAGRQRMWGFVWQGRAYEGLTSNALEWIHSAGGGTLVDRTGTVTIDNKNAAQALRLAASWVGTITPPGVLNYTEEEARAAFQAGDAVFMRNWPYAMALANRPESSVAGKIGIVRLPRGDQGASTATLGGSQLAVSRYSRAPEAAIDLVRALTSAEEQKRRAIKGGFNPTIEPLYRDPELLAVMPWLRELQEILAGAIARPSAVTGRRYNQVSNEFWNAVHVVLSGRQPAEVSLSALAARLRFLSRGEQW